MSGLSEFVERAARGICTHAVCASVARCITKETLSYGRGIYAYVWRVGGASSPPRAWARRITPGD